MADVLAVRDEYREQTWAMLIRECNNSGLTKREFCQQRGFSEKSFYYWLRKLTRWLRQPVPSRFKWILFLLRRICFGSIPGRGIEIANQCGY